MALGSVVEGGGDGTRRPPRGARDPLELRSRYPREVASADCGLAREFHLRCISNRIEQIFQFRIVNSTHVPATRGRARAISSSYSISYSVAPTGHTHTVYHTARPLSLRGPA